MNKYEDKIDKSIKSPGDLIERSRLEAQKKSDKQAKSNTKKDVAVKGLI